MTERTPRFSLRTLVLGFIALNIVLSACTIFYYALVIGNSRFRTEWDHGVKLPPSARNFQCRGDAYKLVLDRWAVSLFEMDNADAPAFFAQLQTESQYTIPGQYDPLNPSTLHYSIQIGGRTPVWTYVPGSQFGNVYGWRKTWNVDPSPIRAMHCRSPKGDWVRIVEWEVDGHRLIQMYALWN